MYVSESNMNKNRSKKVSRIKQTLSKDNNDS